MADNLAHTEFSEHGQCLALIADTLTGEQPRRCFEQLLTAPDLKRAIIYFSFYLMETWQKFGHRDLILDRIHWMPRISSTNLSSR
jgi:alpha-L-rhamnosidase